MNTDIQDSHKISSGILHTILVIQIQIRRMQSRTGTENDYHHN